MYMYSVVLIHFNSIAANTVVRSVVALLFLHKKLMITSVRMNIGEV